MKIKIFILLFLCTIQILLGQTQSPEEFLGYQLGERFTNHHRVVDYFKYVASENDNVKLIKYGETYEHRPLYLSIISSSENIGKLDEIKKNHLSATGLIDGSGQDNLAVVWLSYNVHGNESVSTEAAMKTLYALIDKENTETKKWLENTIVIIDPCINPDGRDRYVNWYNQYKNTPYNVNPDSREHHEPWPGGRTNHYYFDLNRDWAWATQKETRQRLDYYNQWMPHIHVDFHEQGVDNPYYFAPAAQPYHEAITPFQRDFQKTIGKNHAKYFDKNGWLYFTREVFDLLYPSYGDTYPVYNGAIGMTYEQGGSSRAGLGIINAEGNELTLKDRIAHHYTTGLSTIEVASENAGKLTAEFKNYFKNAIAQPAGKYKSYIISSDNNKDKLSVLKALLDKHNIQYNYISGNGKYKAFDYQSGKTTTQNFKNGDLLITARQPKSVLIQSLFEPQTVITDSLTYDITAWAIPYSHGLKAYATTSEIKGKKMEAVDNPQYISGVKKPYAYLARWEHVNDARFLADLLQQKIKLRFATKPFRIDGENYAAGTLIITRTGNVPDDFFDQMVTQIAIEHKRHIKGVSTGFVDSGADFGSGSVRFLKAPKIAVLAGDGISSYSFGEIWHFFEQQLAYPIAVLGTDYFQRVALQNYDVLILPNGWYSNLLGENQLQSLKKWVQQGGRLIVMGNALDAFAKSDLFDFSYYKNEEEKKTAEENETAKKEALLLENYDDLERHSISNMITGSIFKATMDTTHPLGFGYGNMYHTLRLNSKRYVYLPNGSNVSVIKDKADLVSGFVGVNALEKVGKSLVFGVEDIGRGEVVYLVDNPLFRGFWQNGKLLFCNALLLVGQ
ncbi:MAG: zinc carboxypeptidase [Flavobacteriales bacterium]|nr:MAG: zinc carboxypeptidase [Flavobacteriales bacterium]